MNQNNLTNLENLKNLKYRVFVLLPDSDNCYQVVFSDTDAERVEQLATRLRKLKYHAIVHSEAFWNGYWEHEANVLFDIEYAKRNYSFVDD
ncbi:hypothetical protein [Pleurocapsa sp. FMAR1]|uniref:hypothetical protein n=1 Tax=Pleurocapsa sp. FMAR1 TaxID=3040204 RepID=UPI0029C73E7C|nr:hypothetical protein [Pleurocapsa sp. FMAR1]